MDEYRRWKRDVDLWMELTKIEKPKQASHIILSGIQNAEIKDVVATIPKSRHTTDNGMMILLQTMDKHFMPNTFARKIEVWGNLIKTEKTDKNTWTEFIRKMRKWRTEMLSLDLNFPEDLSCIAFLYATKLDTSMKVQVEVIDEFTRLSNAVIIPNKKPESIVKAIMMGWIEKYGICDKLLHDLGGEFNGNPLIEILGILGIRQMTTAAYSPFSNGVVERHNAVIKNTMDKLQNDSSFKSLEPEILLSHAVIAKNSLLNRHGFSPFQLVFGKDN